MVSDSPLVGIARLASEGELLERKRRVSYRTLPSRQWLNPCHSARVPFQWTINPYRGCEFGCKYCYARFTHEFLEKRDVEAFETEIYAKDFEPAAFRAELKKVKPGQTIGIGTATDPYQPSERRYRRTQQALEALNELSGLGIRITTKSNLIASDRSLLSALSARHDVRVAMTVTTLDDSLARATEPFAPLPELRLEAVRLLAQAKVPVGVIASPVLPMITDRAGSIEKIAQAAKSAGAQFFSAGVLFLRPETQRVFFPFLAARYPEYLHRYEKAYVSSIYLKGAYPASIERRVTAIRARCGFPERYEVIAPAFVVPEAQLRLF